VSIAKLFNEAKIGRWLVGQQRLLSSTIALVQYQLHFNSNRKHRRKTSSLKCFIDVLRRCLEETHRDVPDVWEGQTEDTVGFVVIKRYLNISGGTYSITAWIRVSKCEKFTKKIVFCRTFSLYQDPSMNRHVGKVLSGFPPDLHPDQRNLSIQFFVKSPNGIKQQLTKWSVPFFA
jgi:hypothetical protein